VIFGDPHIFPFDHPKVARRSMKKTRTNIFTSGDYWLVKSSYVHIQARYWIQNRWGLSSTGAVAVGGPFLQGNRLIIEPKSGGKIYWNEHEILFDWSSEFHVDGLVHVRAHTDYSGVKLSSYAHHRRPMETIEVELPWDVKLKINRFDYRLDVRITMRQLPGGQDGHCGNFNGNALDDDTASIKERFGTQISGQALLFQKKEYEFVGCFGDLEHDRDFPLQRKDKHMDIVGCSALCSGYKYFARQANGMCFCGDEYGKHGPALGCACSTANVGHSRNCVYQLLDAAPVEEPTLEDCPASKRELGQRQCEEAFGVEDKSTDFVEACVYDYCFGGSEFVDEDAASVGTMFED